MHWRSGRRTRRFLCRQPRRGKFFPERQIHGRLPSGIHFLQGLELSLQLAQGKRKIELRSDKQGLNEKNRAKKDQDPCDKQGKAKARPAFPSWIGKNKRSYRGRGILFHFANDTILLAKQ